MEGTVLLADLSVAVPMLEARGALAPAVGALAMASTVQRTPLLLAAVSEEARGTVAQSRAMVAPAVVRAVLLAVHHATVLREEPLLTETLPTGLVALALFVAVLGTLLQGTVGPTEAGVALTGVGLADASVGAVVQTHLLLALLPPVARFTTALSLETVPPIQTLVLALLLTTVHSVIALFTGTLPVET